MKIPRTHQIYIKHLAKHEPCTVDELTKLTDGRNTLYHCINRGLIIDMQDRGITHNYWVGRFYLTELGRAYANLLD